MTANQPLRLLAIDPGLAHVGIAIVNVTGMHQVEIDRTWTVNTKPAAAFLDRLQKIADEVYLATEAAETDHGAYYAVVEDPRTMIQSDARGRRKDPRTLAALMAAFGAIVASVQAASQCQAVELVPVLHWYPRKGHAPMKQVAALAAVRLRFPELARESEHVCMAVGLADWWSANVAPRIWYELDRQPKEAADA